LVEHLAKRKQEGKSGIVPLRCGSVGAPAKVAEPCCTHPEENSPSARKVGRKYNQIPRPQIKSLGGTACKFHNISCRRANLDRTGNNPAGKTYNPAFFIEENNIQLEVRVLHPENPRGGFGEHEEHTTARREIAAVLKTNPPAFVISGKFKTKGRFGRFDPDIDTGSGSHDRGAGQKRSEQKQHGGDGKEP